LWFRKQSLPYTYILYIYRVISKSLCTWLLQYKTRKNILNNFNHHDNVIRIRDNRWRLCESGVNKRLETGGGHFEYYL
jgi:hypothetical protein